MISKNYQPKSHITVVALIDKISLTWKTNPRSLVLVMLESPQIGQRKFHKKSSSS